MVQLYSTFFVLASLIVAGISAPNAKRSVDKIKGDLVVISSQITALNTAIVELPVSGGTLAQVLAIHSSTVRLCSSLDMGTVDVKDTVHFGETDGQSILNSVRNSKPIILNALSVIITKKPAFMALHIAPGIVMKDLTNLAASTAGFENALIVAGPADLKDPATAIKAELDVGFGKAIAAYST